MGTASRIAENISKIRERMEAAAARCGREPGEIRLVAVSKRQPPEAVREAQVAGLTEFGESYLQEAEPKIIQLAGTGVVWHLIGHLQRNKAGRTAALFDVVQSVDSQALARVLGVRATALGKRLDVLVEVNVSGEESKSGVAPERALDLCGEVAGVSGLRLCGLMAIGPLSERAGESLEASTRSCFSLAARLFERLPVEHRQVLSMGMTGDFELAIEEGSTMVRVGTGIFGARRDRVG